jgi:hypothetical protein
MLTSIQKYPDNFEMAILDSLDEGRHARVV